MLLGVVGDNTENEETSDELDVTTNQVNNDSDNLAQKDADMSAKIATDLSPGKKENSPPIITGSPHLEVQQDEEYTFTPLSKDPENDKLRYTISNKPRWLKFDSRTGSLSGRPDNFDIGKSREITITVWDAPGDNASLKPFYINVINKNDSPTISGIPNELVGVGNYYSFRPKVQDPDIRIGKDKLKFSIQNKPEWASFNPKTGLLKGVPSNDDIETTEGISITVTDSYGISVSLAPFDIIVAPKATNNYSEFDDSAPLADKPDLIEKQDSSGFYISDRPSNDVAIEPYIQDSFKSPEQNREAAQSGISGVITSGGSSDYSYDAKQDKNNNAAKDKNNDANPTSTNNQKDIVDDQSNDTKETFIASDGSSSEETSGDTEQSKENTQNQSLVDKESNSKTTSSVPNESRQENTASNQTASNAQNETDNQGVEATSEKNIFETLVDTFTDILTPPSQENITNPNNQKNNVSDQSDNSIAEDKANASDNPKSHLIKVKDPDENEDENLLVSLLDNQKLSWLEISEQGNNNWSLELKLKLKEDIDNKQLIAGYHNLTLTVTDKEGDSSSKNLTLNLINQIDSDMRFENITTTIPVCWDYTSTFDNYETFIKAQINSDIEQYQNDIKQMVNETWEASAEIEFIGWSEDCTSDDQRLKLVIAGPQSTYNSKYLVEANTVVFVLNSNNADQIDIDRRTIIHEFGHALGFPDEHKRFDVFRAGDQNIIGSNNEVVCKDIPNGMPILADEHNYHGDARKLHQLKVVTMKQWQEQPYDPFSIMNDCTTNQEYMENNGNKLSAADKKRAQQFYGAILKGTAKAHLMNNDEYFTGLYKNENYYHFYEYGVRNEDYEEVRVSDREESYFYILNKEGNNPILFKKVNQASDNIFIKPDNSNLISCRKPHGENTNTLMKSNCGKPEDYETIVNPTTIYHFDDPYGPKNSFYLVYCGDDVSETITKDGLKYNVVDYSESNCLTKINRFKVNPLEHHYTERLFTANPKEKKNSVWFFRKGKALSGRIGPNANIRLKDGNNNPAPSLVIKNNQLVYTIDDSPFTGYIPNPILLWPEIIDMEEGYYLGGNLIPSDKINEKVESVTWKYLQTNSTYQIERNNVYVEYQGKLYKNGQLYTGIFEDVNYSEGVLDQ